MMRKFVQAFHLAGTAAADLTFVWTAPSPCQLVHVSAVGSNDHDATMSIGTTASAAAYLAALSAIGDSNVPAEFERTDFVGDQFPDIADGTVVAVAVVYGDVLGTAINDLTIVLTFVEG